MIKNHIIPGDHEISNLGHTELQSMANYPVILRSFGGKAMVGKSVIRTRNIQAGNGRLNIIDNYLSPIDDNIYRVMKQIEEPKILVFRALLDRANMRNALEESSRARKMLWIPSDSAFLKLSSATLLTLFSDVNKLRDVLNFHITPGYFSTKLMTKQWVYVFRTAANGAKVRARKFNNSSTGIILFNNREQTARTLKVDIVASNGLVHIIDSVLFPPGVQIPGL